MELTKSNSTGDFNGPPPVICAISPFGMLQKHYGPSWGEKDRRQQVKLDSQDRSRPDHERTRYARTKGMLLVGVLGVEKWMEWRRNKVLTGDMGLTIRKIV